MPRRSLIVAVAASAVAGALSAAPGTSSAAGAVAATPDAQPRTARTLAKPALADARAEVVPGRFLVTWRSGAARPGTRAVHRSRGARLLARIPGSAPIDVVHVGRGPGAARTLAAYASDPRVAAVEPDLLRHPLGHVPAMPNDPKLTTGEQWGLHNEGGLHEIADPGPQRARGTADADIDAPDAWATQQGEGTTTTTVLAIVDTGVNVSHQDIAGNLWVNPHETPGNGIDDDTNGCVDDIHGCNMGTGTGTALHDPTSGSQKHGHGTHVAGIAAAVTHNAKGVAGVCPDCRILVVKLGAVFTTSKIIAAFAYVRRLALGNEDVRFVVNGSFGGGAYSKAERNAILALGRADVPAVFAAGNSSLDNDIFLVDPSTGRFSPSFPASYDLPTTIAVQASNHADEPGYATGCVLRGSAKWRCAFTSFGGASTDLAAPGVDVYSSTACSNSCYRLMNGTSMAAPHVTGVAGLVLAEHPEYTAEQVRYAILHGVDRPAGLRTMYSPLFGRRNATGRFSVTGGRLNAAGALAAPTTGFAVTDANVAGATPLAQRARGRVAYPADVNDVYRKRLVRGTRYEVRLTVPRGADHDLWMYRPGTLEINQLEPGCLGARGSCPIIGRSRNGGATDERIVLTAPKTGVYYLQVQSWIGSAGRYTLTIRRI